MFHLVGECDCILSIFKIRNEKRIRKVLGRNAFIYQRPCGEVRTTKLLMTTMNTLHQLIAEWIIAASADEYRTNVQSNSSKQ